MTPPATEASRALPPRSKADDAVCHHYRAAKFVPEHFVAEFSLKANQRTLFAELSAEQGEGGAWPLKPTPGLRVDADGELEAFAAEWGLLPFWWKPSDAAKKRSAFQRKTINARAETAAEKPTFRDAWKRRRCLLPCDEFFERGFYFGIGEPMAFAGLWESWRGGDGDAATSCTLLTTEPCAEVRGVGHHRMPVLLTTPEERWRWLAADGDAALLRPLADGRLVSRTVE